MLDPAFVRRVKRREAIARVVIVSGGILIIVSVLGILFQIAGVAIPLFKSPSSARETSHSVPSGVLGVGLDDYLETAYVLREDGDVVFLDVDAGTILKTVELISPGDAEATIRGVDLYPPDDYSILWSDGSVSVERISMTPAFDEEGTRFIEHRVIRLLESGPGDDSMGLPERSVARSAEGGGLTRVDLVPGNRIHLTQVSRSEDLFGNVEESTHAGDLPGELPGTITSFVLNGEGTALYAATGNGYLLRWGLTEPGRPELLDRILAFADERPIPAIHLVFGDYTLAVGDAAGGVTGWFPVTSKTTGGRKALSRIHVLPGHSAPIRSVLPTRRNKAVLVLDENGGATLDHVTSERRLVRFRGEHPLALANLNARADGLIALDVEGSLVTWRIDTAHPDVSLGTLFGKVWYEGYDEPAFCWQSSSASADYEPKMSLVPLMFGTLKGTLYAMIFAVPAAILGALYTSQFLHPRLRGMIKPAIEVMAAIPSVVIGFLAALWFAPLLERNFGGIMISLVLLPGVILGSVFLWEVLGLGNRLRRIRFGYEFLLLAPSIIAGVWVSLLLGGIVEELLFAGDFQSFLFNDWGVRYDPRNCIVISFALGFAVIPIIFSMAEDALSNVPRSLAAGSLALGASRWQTAWRVILPGAAPGIFAAVMIGLGRAIGETMIVLMATGNTAIMDWSPFNGMRTISANIATEAPEAPYLSSLYRVLFLSAVILFVSTFVLNTVAEVVRQRIRKKYARF